MKKKKFTFPRNVDTSYAIIAGLSGKDICCYILPSLIIPCLLALIPPYTSILFWIIKIFILVIFIAIALIFALVRPIKDRPNIRMIDCLKTFSDFSKRQKVFYMKKKDRGITNE